MKTIPPPTWISRFDAGFSCFALARTSSSFLSKSPTDVVFSGNRISFSMLKSLRSPRIAHMVSSHCVDAASVAGVAFNCLRKISVLDASFSAPSVESDISEDILRLASLSSLGVKLASMQANKVSSNESSCKILSRPKSRSSASHSCLATRTFSSALSCISTS